MFPEAKRFIQEFCTTHFYTMFPTTQQRDDYKTGIQSLPHVYEATPLGGAVKARVNVLCELIKQMAVSYTHLTLPTICSV